MSSTNNDNELKSSSNIKYKTTPSNSLPSVLPTTTPSTPSKKQTIQQQQTNVNNPSSTTTTTATNTSTSSSSTTNTSTKNTNSSSNANNHINTLLNSGPPQLSPPALFGIIEPQLYRTNSLYPVNFPFIKMLGLKTVVQLSPEVPIKAVSNFFQENNINLIHLGLKSWNVDSSWKPLTDELVKECLEIVLNYDYYPLMITCTSGVHQSGVLVGCLRRIQNWNLTSILVEYKAFSGQSNSRYVNEQFIELYDVDLVTLPNKLPTWFVEQQKMLEEELENDNPDEFLYSTSNSAKLSKSYYYDMISTSPTPESSSSNTPTTANTTTTATTTNTNN
ncbi:hypothetical protein CYY_008536 [Polysphondylium violaceum]|uniref:Uncharacterized protein n=1 Tax=Polysphondylium violaceum TaxID=133409 RepID=A0A8J4PV15_9MYCE|nr:hypothetical protein CYY_008536 [Polysphondylium violaceum]